MSLNSLEELLSTKDHDGFDYQFAMYKNEEVYKEYILAYVEELNNNFNLPSNQIVEKLCNILRENSLFHTRYKTDAFNVLELIKKCDQFIDEENILSIFFSLNDIDTAEEYIKFNYDKLKHAFQNKFLAFDELDYDEFGLDIFEYKFLIKELYNKKVSSKDIFTIPCLFASHTINYLLYKYFINDLHFIFLHHHPNDDLYYGICHSLSWEYTRKILNDLYNKKDFESFESVVAYSSLAANGKIDLSNEPFYNIEFIASVFLPHIKKTNKRYFSSDSNFSNNAKNYEMQLRNSIKPSTKPATTLFSNDYFANLNYLKNIPRSARSANSIYQRNLEIFISFCQNYFSFSIDDYQSVLRSVFNRIINGNSMFAILMFDSEASLYHYYKTNEIMAFDKNEKNILNVKNYNTKQYWDIKKLLLSEYENSTNLYIVPIFDEKELAGKNAITFLSFFPYDILRKLILAKTKKEALKEISEYDFKDENMRLKFIKIISNDLETFRNNEQNFKMILKIFIYLYKNGYQNITLKKIIKRIASAEYLLTPNCIEIKDNIDLLNFVSKGEPIDEKIEGIKLYNEYRFRKYSSIPNLEGTYNNLEYEMVDMHSPEIISNGIGAYLHSNTDTTASSCLTPAGKAASCLRHGAINEHGRFFKITYNKKIVAYSWVWRAGDILCFDNIEVTNQALKFKNYQDLIVDIYKKVGQELISISEKYENNPIKAVTIGRNKLDVIDKPLTDLQATKCFKPNISEGIYITDSQENQYLLVGSTENISTSDVTPIYQYQRKPIQEIFLDDEETRNKLNSIYFDYCIYKNIKYHQIINKYTNCYLGDDWFIGFYDNGVYDFYYRKYSKEVLKEASEYINIDINKEEIKKPIIIGKYPDIDYYINPGNYQYNIEDVLEYLRSLKSTLKSITPADFFHTASGIKATGKILYDHAITSVQYGKHLGGNGSNGKHFVCIAELSSELYKKLMKDEGFIIDKNICSFATCIDTYDIRRKKSSKYSFGDSRYPIREEGHEGERQVLDYISLDSAKAIQVNDDIKKIGMITYLQERTNNHLPLVYKDKYYLIDSEEIKRLIKLK